MTGRLITMTCLGAAIFSTILANGQTTAIDAMRSTFSSHPVSKVTLSGTANWYAGSLKDSGTVTLTAASDGSAQMQLMLGQSGERTESQLAIGPSMKCQWSGADAKVHQADYLNCLKPAVWFLPSLGFQSGSLPASISVSDLGIETASDGGYRHLRAQFAPSAIGDTTAIPNPSQAGITDIDVDPNSALPVALRYRVRPDNGANIEIPIMVKFSDYRAINGVQIPYLIERYVNGTLQLQITIQSSQID
ncbi:MAG TPA: hypothetical protein VFU86_02105 [Terriglobales bacterium]|nr:hypothetical protein [Terriglobales bacterium]